MPISSPAIVKLLAKSTIFFSFVNHYTEDMANFTVIGEIFNSMKYFCNTKVHVAGLGEIFFQQNFQVIHGISTLAHVQRKGSE